MTDLNPFRVSLQFKAILIDITHIIILSLTLHHQFSGGAPLTANVLIRSSPDARTTMVPSSSTTSPTATATPSVNEPHKRTFPFAAFILLALCIAYIAGYLAYRRILNWNAKRNAEKEQNYPNEFFEKKSRGAFDSLSATLHRTHEMIIMKARLASHGSRV
ncbi:hypothetical protein BDR07DRAFT_1414844 [Suillus spraguei]|nr:hypothetical protein BDR07DRAFT_1414844 [Suillus spraguei]